jgi:dienelactone hydrolase
MQGLAADASRRRRRDRSGWTAAGRHQYGRDEAGGGAGLGEVLLPDDGARIGLVTFDEWLLAGPELMARVVLFHHAQGLRPDVLDWAEALREAGHEVETPDLYEGTTFDRLEEGIAHRDELGIPALMKKAGDFLEGLPAELVYAGFSMGASTAHYFALTRPGTRGLLLMHGTAPAQSLGDARWPSGLAAQLHRKDDDPEMADEGVEALERSAGGAVEVFIYPGTGHLFADPAGPDYDEEAATSMLERELEFLRRVAG